MRRSGHSPWPHHPAHPLVVAPSHVDPTGRWGPTPKAARGPTQRRVTTSWYVPSGVDGSAPAQRIAEAAVVLPAYGAVTGWAGLHWMGGRWFDGCGPGLVPLPVPLAVGGGSVRPTDGWAVSKERLLPDDIEVVDGLRVTTAVRSVLFEMRYARTLDQAVAHLDMAAFNDLVSIEEARAYADQLSSCTGIPLAREAIEWADENAWSPTEVRERIVWVRDAGLPCPLTNRPIFDLDGRFVFTPDVIDPVAGVAGQYDGGIHLTRSVKDSDVRRDELCRALGLEQVVMTGSDLADPSAFVQRARASYARAAARPAADRRWTLETPSWWKPTVTVEQRRAMSPADRARLLRHRLPDSH